MTPTWDILICSIWHRTAMLDELLGELERQAQPGLGVRVFRDNLENEYGAKCQRLLDSSTADYVSKLDDDDWVASDYVQRIMAAQASRPDYVGHGVLYTEDGERMLPMHNSLANGRWEIRDEVMLRDIVHLNPIRRDLAHDGHWAHGLHERWANEVRAAGRVSTEVWAGDNLYHYRHRLLHTFHAPRQPLADQPARPDRPLAVWVP